MYCVFVAKQYCCFVAFHLHSAQTQRAGAPPRAASCLRACGPGVTESYLDDQPPSFSALTLLIGSSNTLLTTLSTKSSVMSGVQRYTIVNRPCV